MNPLMIMSPVLVVFSLFLIAIIREKVLNSRIENLERYAAALGKLILIYPYFTLHLGGEYAGFITCDCPHCNGKPFACSGDTKCIHCDHLIGITPAEANLLASAPKYFG